MVSGLFQGQKVTLELGSCHTVLALEAGRTILREPSLVALAARRKQPGRPAPPTPALPGSRVLGVGTLAADLEFRNESGVYWVSPVEVGRIVEPLAMEALLRGLFSQVPFSRWRSLLTGLQATLVISPHLNPEELRMQREALRNFGFRKITEVASTLAGALGSGMDISRVNGKMVVDFGGGKTTVTTFSMGETCAWHWAPFGGQHLDQAIATHVEAHYRVRLTPTQAASLKHGLGSVFPGRKPESVPLTGLDTTSGVVKKFNVDDNEIRDSLVDACETLVMAIQKGFEQLSPEMAGDIAREGVTLVGGGALLEGLPAFLMDRTGLVFHPAPDPINATIRGGILSADTGR